MKPSGRAEHGGESESIEFVPKRELDRAQQEVVRLRKQSERLQKENERLKEEAERLRRELEAAFGRKTPIEFIDGDDCCWHGARTRDGLRLMGELAHRHSG